MLRHFRIKHKIQVILLLEAIVLGLSGWFSVTLSFRIYDRQIYEEFADKFYLYSNTIEDALSEYEKLSFIIATEPTIQRDLQTLSEAAGSYEAVLASRALENKLMTYPFFERYIDSIELLDADLNQISAGVQVSPFDAEEKQSIISAAALGQGAVVWRDQLDQRGSLLATRSILAVKNLNLDNLGTLVIRINMEKLLQASALNIQNYGSQYFILSGEHLLYPQTPVIPIEKLLQEIPRSDGYRDVRLSNDRYMLMKATFQSTGWTFVNLIGYNDIFTNILVMKLVLAASQLATLLLVLYFSIRIAKSITNRLEHLTKKIIAAGKGYFDVGEPDAQMPNRDEIGLLGRDFDKMLGKIDTLIKENYLKQLVLKETEYQALRAKINPHFLYNTFDSINWLAKMNGQEQISRMVKALGDLLRSSISDKEFIPLEEELTLLQKYILIQKCRFEDKLAFRMEIDEQLYAYYIPNFILQPLVENAIHYGVEESRGVCEITVQAELVTDGLQLCVRDTGPGVDEQLLDKLAKGEPVSKGSGVGLTNIDQRIKMLCGSEYGIRIRNAAPRGTEVIVTLPMSLTD